MTHHHNRMQSIGASRVSPEWHFQGRGSHLHISHLVVSDVFPSASIPGHGRRAGMSVAESGRDQTPDQAYEYPSSGEEGAEFPS